MTNAETLPDYVLDDNAVLKDDVASWRYGKAPDYSKTRAFYQDSKSMAESEIFFVPIHSLRNT
jgi:hypothetical protein